MNYRFGIYLLLITVLIPSVFSSYDEYVEFYDMSKDDSLYRASYDFDFRGNFSRADNFEVELYYNNESKGEVCKKQIKTNEQSIFKKITCQFNRLGTGEYELVNKITRDSEVLYQFSTSFYESNDVYGYYQFEDTNENSTKVILNLKGNKSDVKVYSDIPSSVIPELTPENKDSLITSNKNYTIVEENPLIAWNVENIPEDIEYEVEKKVSNEEKQKFTLKIEENSTFLFVKFISGLGIFIILLLLLLSMIKKTKTNKKK